MSRFTLQLNGAVLGKSLTIPSGQTEYRTIQIVHSRGANAAGKLVHIETSAPTYIDTLNGNLDANGHFQFIIGPSFGTRGSVSLTVDVGGPKKSLDVTFS